MLIKNISEEIQIFNHGTPYDATKTDLTVIVLFLHIPLVIATRLSRKSMILKKLLFSFYVISMIVFCCLVLLF